MRYLQTHVQKTTDNGCCALISQVSKGWLISDHKKKSFQSYSPTFFEVSDWQSRYQKFENTKNNYQNPNGQKNSVELSLVSKEIKGQLMSEHIFLPFNYP